jgi:hypothetical protein
VLYGVVSPQALVLSAWERALPTPEVLARDRWLGRALLSVALAALLRYLWRADGSERLFWLAAALGIVLSAPVVYGDAGLRGLGASFPLLAGLLAIGLGRGLRRPPPARTVEMRATRTMAWGAAGLVLIALAGPRVAHAAAPQPGADGLASPPPDTFVVWLHNAPAIVVSSRPRPDVDATVLPRRQYERHLELANVSASGFDRPDPPFALISAYDRVSRRQRVLVVAPEALAARGFVRVRARPAAEDDNLLIVSEWAETR